MMPYKISHVYEYTYIGWLCATNFLVMMFDFKCLILNISHHIYIYISYRGEHGVGVMYNVLL